jgi:hypothetical protein
MNDNVKSVKRPSQLAAIFEREPAVEDVVFRRLRRDGGVRILAYLRLRDDAPPLDLVSLRRSAQEAAQTEDDMEIQLDIVVTDLSGAADPEPEEPVREPGAFRQAERLDEALAQTWEPPKTPLAGAFAARALRAVDRLANDLPEEILARAVAAKSDLDALLGAFLRADLVGATGDPMASARVRGVRAARRLLEAEGGVVSGEELGELLGISRQAIHARRKAGKLLALETGRHGLRYPTWQVTARGLLPGLEETLAVLGDTDAWMQARFFLADNPRLDGRRPLDALRDGDVEPVLEAARAHGEHGAA